MKRELCPPHLPTPKRNSALRLRVLPKGKSHTRRAESLGHALFRQLASRSGSASALTSLGAYAQIPFPAVRPSVSLEPSRVALATTREETGCSLLCAQVARIRRFGCFELRSREKRCREYA